MRNDDEVDGDRFEFGIQFHLRQWAAYMLHAGDCKMVRIVSYCVYQFIILWPMWDTSFYGILENIRFTY